MFSRTHLNTAVLAGDADYQTYGLNESSTSPGDALLQATKTTIPDVLDAADLLSVLFMDGAFVGAASEEVPEFRVSVLRDNPIYNTLTVLNDARVDNISNIGIFNRAQDTGVGSAVFIQWTASDADDFNNASIYYDEGDGGRGVADFVLVDSVFDQRITQYTHRGLATGTYRYFVTFTDIYGNRGDAASPDVKSVTLVTAPTLAGEWSITGLDALFGVTDSSNVVSVKVYMNYVFGVGVVDYINYDNPLGVQPVPSLSETDVHLPEGTIQLAAVGYDKFGNRTAPILETVLVLNGDSTDFIAAPENVSSETLAAGENYLYFDDPNETENWEHLNLRIYESDETTLVANMTFNRQDSPLTVVSGLGDGSYRAKLRFYSGTSSSVYSEFCDMLIDSTYPPGADIIFIQAI